MVRYRIQLPAYGQNHNPGQLDQDEAFFILKNKDDETRIRFHDYKKIYSIPGLYEQLFYERLKCTSPSKIAATLKQATGVEGFAFSELRVLDLGAGNGMVGEELRHHGVSRVVGVDIIPEAKAAAERDRPGAYDDYYACDITDLDPTTRVNLQEWRFNCMVTVAALGFGDIPVDVFREAYNLVEDNGWVAFNIKETFLEPSDQSGFSRFIKELLVSNKIQLHHMERYRHRYSIDGLPLYYFAIVLRKKCPLLP